MNAAKIAGALHGRRNGAGWRCPCPAHDDRDPSLDVIERDGRTLFVCRAGCDQEQVIDALRARGLWRANGGAALQHPDFGRPDVEYEYHAIDGRLIGTICRWNRPGGKKEIRPAVRDGGAWRWRAFPDPRPLYNLPDLAAQPTAPVLIVEGEKAADAARDLVPGYVVSTWPGGAGAVGKVDLAALAGRDVVLWPDADAPGKAAMRALADRLATVAKTIRGVRLPDGLPAGWDLADAIPADLDPVALIGRAPSVKSDQLAALGLINAAALVAKKFRDPRWAIPDLVAEGLNILAGKPKTGKSWLALNFAVAVAGGGAALGNVPCEAGDALYLALEDTERRLNGRLKAVLQGAPAPARLDIAIAWKRTDEGGLDDLRAWLDAHPSARLVMIDTLQKIRGARKRDAGIYEDDYRAIAELKALADEFTVPIVILHHLRKDAAGDPLESVSGTSGLTGSADTILVLKREVNEKNAMLYVRGRDVPESEAALAFDDDTGCWTKLVAADDWRQSEQRRAIIRALIDGGPMTPKEIAEAVEAKAGAVRFLLHKMHKEGAVDRLNNGRYRHVQ